MNWEYWLRWMVKYLPFPSWRVLRIFLGTYLILPVSFLLILFFFSKTTKNTGPTKKEDDSKKKKVVSKREEPLQIFFSKDDYFELEPPNDDIQTVLPMIIEKMILQDISDDICLCQRTMGEGRI
jgi:hypothetical protein